MDMKMSPLKLKILLESSPPKSRILLQRWAVGIWKLERRISPAQREGPTCLDPGLLDCPDAQYIDFGIISPTAARAGTWLSETALGNECPLQPANPEAVQESLQHAADCYFSVEITKTRACKMYMLFQH